MKLPGNTLIPCRNQMLPIITSSTPTMFKTIRTFPPAVSPNIPLWLLHAWGAFG